MKCRNKIPAIDLEDAFHERLKQFVLSPEKVAHFVERGSATKGLDPYSGKTLIEIPLADQSDVDEALRYNSRFLILPWVRVKDLASSILASASGGPSHLPGTSLHLRIIVAN